MSRVGPLRKRSAKHEKTMGLILQFLRCMKTKKYADCSQLLYEIRTSDLREMLPELGPNHPFYRLLLDVLKDPKHWDSQPEALYNLAVIVSNKQNVTSLLKLDLIEIVLLYCDQQNSVIQHRALWCLFGIGASTPESRELCLKRGVLAKAISIMLETTSEQVMDMSGQIIYGMFHMRPLPAPALIEPFVEKCTSLLRLPDSPLKYILWALHFVGSDGPGGRELLTKLGLVQYLRPLMKSNQSAVLIPLMIILSHLFHAGSTEFDPFLLDFTSPLGHFDCTVRVQTARSIADYIRGENTIQEMLAKGMYERMIKVAQEDEVRVREQAVYSIVRGFGFGSDNQRRMIADMGGLKALLSFTVLAVQPFLCNLLDCMDALVEEDEQFFIPKMKQVRAVQVLYKLLAFTDQVVTSKAANLLGLIGDGYQPGPE
jgi:hypothetical protein